MDIDETYLRNCLANMRAFQADAESCRFMAKHVGRLTAERLLQTAKKSEAEAITWRRRAIKAGATL